MASAIDKFCGSTFWDHGLTWNTTNPVFTPCFQNTVFVWIPCGFLWLFAPMETYYLIKSPNRNIPWTGLNITKIVITAILAVLSVVDMSYSVHRSASLGYQVSSVDYYAPFIKLMTLLLVACFLVSGRKRGIQSSGILFLFWFLLAMAGLLQYRSYISKAVYEQLIESEVLFGTYMVYYPLVLAQFLLAFVADAHPEYREHYRESDQNECPEESASFISQLLYWWYNGLAIQGWRRALVQSDLWSLNYGDRTESVVPYFEKYWNVETTNTQTINKSASFSPSKNREEVKIVSDSSANKKKQPNIAMPLFKAFGSLFVSGAFFKLFHDILQFASPQILKWLIGFVSTPEEPLWKGIFYAALLFITASLQSLVLGVYFHRMFRVGLRIRTAMISAIYKKSLALSNSSKKVSTVGEIVNLMSVDAQRFMDLMPFLNLIWSAPLQIILALYFLWQELGIAVLAGLGVMILMIPLNGFIANWAKKLQMKQMKLKDHRVKMMNEILNGMKVLKLYAWEKSFQKKILGIRQEELDLLKKNAYLQATSYFLWTCAPFLVTLVTFAVYVLMSPTNVLDASKAFVSLSLFNILRFPMAMLPMLITLMVGVALASFLTYVLMDPTNVLDASKAFVSLALFDILRFPMASLPYMITLIVMVSLMSFATYVLADEKNILDARRAFVALSLFHILRFPLALLPMLISMIVQASVSLKRMNNYLGNEELEPYVDRSKAERDSVVIEGGTFSWIREEDAILKDITLRIPEGALVAVVGQVGCGKSSLLSALLGDMEKLQGHVNLKGSVAYVAQQAWIQNATLEDNILFSKSMDKTKYDRIIEACSLTKDFEILPAGDQTEIGEKGINLSGGQKQRVSLARAVYNDANIYMLDDPLSAVDSHVGKHIFEHVIGPKGILKEKTRLLVTHGIAFLPQTDMIVVLKQGSVSEFGTYKDLLEKKGGAFAEFLIQHLKENVQQDTADLDVVEDIIKKVGSPELERQISQAISENDSQLLGSPDRRPSILRSRSLSRQFSIDSMNSARSQRSLSISKSLTDGQKTDVANGTKGVHPPDDAEKLIQTETAETGEVKMGIYKHYLQAGSVMWGVLVLLANVTQQGFSMGSNIWLSYWSNDPAPVNDTIDTALRDMRLGVYGGLGLGQGVTVLLGSFALALGTLQASRILHSEMLYNILRSPMSFFDTTPLGRIVNRFAKDVDTVDSTIPMTLRSWLACFLQVVATVIVISLETPEFLIVIIPVSLMYYFIQRFYVATSRQLKRLESITRSPIYSHFSETLSGVSSIRAYRADQRFIQESNNLVDANQVCYYPSIVANRWLAIRLEFCGNCLVFFAALFAVLGRSSLSAGTVGLSVSYALSVTATLNWMVRMSSELETNIVSVERIREYSTTPSEAEWELESSKPDQQWPVNGEVVFDKYSTRYREGLDLVVKGISCLIKPGEKVGIVGRTGAGKSSLTLSLFRLIEAAGGSIVIDGVDISRIGLHDLRSRLTIIPQDPVLFSGTLRLNLDPFDIYKDEEIWKALEHSHLKAFVSSLESGLEYEVTEGGENLSVGQRQLICLARALLRKTKVLVLDEATAAVDLDTDDLIQATIQKEFSACTVLTIAHRLNTIMDSNRVMVLDKGLIVEFETPTNLLQDKSSVFHGMAKDAGLV